MKIRHHWKSTLIAGLLIMLMSSMASRSGAALDTSQLFEPVDDYDSNFNSQSQSPSQSLNTLTNAQTFALRSATPEDFTPAKAPNRIFYFRGDQLIEMTSENTEHGENRTHRRVFVPGNEPFAITGERYDHEGGQTELRLGMDQDLSEQAEPNAAPNDFWVRKQELLRAEPLVVNRDAIPRDEQGNLATPKTSDPYSVFIDTVTGREQVALATPVAASRGKKKAKKVDMTYCYAEVKDYLVPQCGFSSRPGGIFAVQGYKELRDRFGFTPVSQYSSQLPQNSVCVFSGGRKGDRCKNAPGGACGHIAVKLSNTSEPEVWYGQGLRSSPFLPGRKLLGCLTPPPQCQGSNATLKAALLNGKTLMRATGVTPTNGHLPRTRPSRSTGYSNSSSRTPGQRAATGN